MIIHNGLLSLSGNNMEMNLFRIICIGWLLSTVAGCKPSLLEPQADNISCHFPERIGFVNDYCNFLSADEAKKLEQTIADFHTQTGTEIIIVIEDSKKSHAKKFHTPCEISKKWHLDQTENCDDIFIAISRKRAYVEISYGEKISLKITKEDLQIILNKNIIPAFRKKQYYEGLRLAVAYIVSHRQSS